MYVTSRSTVSRYGGNSRSASADEISPTPASATISDAVAGSDRRRSMCRAAAALSAASTPSRCATLATQRGERRRRFHDQHGERVAAPARLEIALAEMQPVAARLHFAGAAQVGGLDPEAVEGIAAGHDHVVGEDGAELEREGVERSAELVRGDESGVARPPSCQASTRAVHARRSSVDSVSTTASVCVSARSDP